MRYTEQQMEVMMVEWQQSGISKKEFCRQRSIKYNTFHYWCKRISSASSTGFTQFNLVKQVNQQHEGGSEIIFLSGTRMFFKGQPSASWLRELVG